MTTSAQNDKTPPTPPDEPASRTASPSSLSTTSQPPSSSNTPVDSTTSSDTAEAGRRNELGALIEDTRPDDQLDKSGRRGEKIRELTTTRFETKQFEDPSNPPKIFSALAFDQ
ncbi:hypothetical protein JCM5350_000724 [Sporobolomyces pararoseus]